MIYKALKIIRLYHNLKQSELADSLCISKSYLSEIESGKKSINFDMLEKYSHKFDIPISSLVFLSEEMDAPSQKSFSEKFRTVFAEKTLKIMEWGIERNEKKKAQNKN